MQSKQMLACWNSDPDTRISLAVIFIFLPLSLVPAYILKFYSNSNSNCVPARQTFRATNRLAFLHDKLSLFKYCNNLNMNIATSFECMPVIGLSTPKVKYDIEPTGYNLGTINGVVLIVLLGNQSKQPKTRKESLGARWPAFIFKLPLIKQWGFDPVSTS